MRGWLQGGLQWLGGALFGAVLSAGCIVPPSLTDEPPQQPMPMNQPPQITRGEPVDFIQNPKFSPAHYLDPWSFAVTAVDEDAILHNEQLVARLFLLDGTTYLPYADIPLSSSAAAPTTFTGQTVSAPWCRNIVAMPNQD